MKNKRFAFLLNEFFAKMKGEGCLKEPGPKAMEDYLQERRIERVGFQPQRTFEFLPLRAREERGGNSFSAKIP